LEKNTHKKADHGPGLSEESGERPISRTNVILVTGSPCRLLHAVLFKAHKRQAPALGFRCTRCYKGALTVSPMQAVMANPTPRGGHPRPVENPQER